MPEDAPEKCVGQDAKDVAQFIHESFYSRSARIRNERPRVELLRLSNRQFAHSVADLFVHFTGPGAVARGQEGLKATYYNARGPNRDKKVEERVDATVDFQYGTSSPDPARIGAEEFSVQWQGGLVAPETGLYEFEVRSPNGLRLWVNDEQDPLIDGWVASGNSSEHRASLRLLGGRTYPLRLSFFKFKDKTASIVLRWKPPRGIWETLPARCLTPAQPTPTFVLSTPFPADDASVGYERGSTISKAWDEAVTGSAIEAAHYSLKHLDRLTQSKEGDTNRVNKIRAFARSFSERALRRPLSPEQRVLLVDRFFEPGLSAEESLKRVVMLAIKSPRFLYPGLQAPSHDSFAAAEKLALALWDSVPDNSLSEAARANRLEDPAAVQAQASRMMRDPRARSKMRHFLWHWLHLDHVEEPAKDPATFPDFTPELSNDLRVSLDLFLDHVVWSDSSDFRRLLLSEDTFLNPRLAKFFNVELEAIPHFRPTRFEAGRRAGVLTHPYVLAAFAYAKTTSPIHRGVFLSRSVVGRPLRPPPEAVSFEEADFEPGLSMREKITRLTRPENCQGCHSIINPLGFSLEHFDAVGRYRESESGRPIDASGDYETEEGRGVRFQSARDVAVFAAESPQAQEAFIEALFHHLVQQPVRAFGDDLLPSLREGFASARFNVQELAIQIALRTSASPSTPLKTKAKSK